LLLLLSLSKKKQKKKKKTDEMANDDALFGDFGEEEKLDEAFYLPDDEKEKEIEVIPWQNKWLAIMENIRMMLFVLVVVIVAVAITIYQSWKVN